MRRRETPTQTAACRRDSKPPPRPWRRLKRSHRTFRAARVGRRARQGGGRNFGQGGARFKRADFRAETPKAGHCGSYVLALGETGNHRIPLGQRPENQRPMGDRFIARHAELAGNQGRWADDFEGLELWAEQGYPLPSDASNARCSRFVTLSRSAWAGGPAPKGEAVSVGALRSNSSCNRSPFSMWPR